MFLYYVDTVDINTCNNVSPTPSHTQPQPLDTKERKGQRDRERYAQMDSDKKVVLLKDNMKPINK